MVTGPGALRTGAGPGHCSRGAWCAWRVTRYEDGQHVTDPAETPRAFCLRDEDLIGEYLAGLPRLYLLLSDELIRARQGDPFAFAAGTAEAQVELNLAVDALMRETADVLISWHERVADGASLAEPGTRHPGWHVQDGTRQVARACLVLGRQLDRLLDLPAEVMSRRMTIAAAARLPVFRPWLSGVVHPAADYADVTLPLGGIDAGLEVFGLRSAARRILGETRPVPDELLGVRCKQCSHMTLYRADQAVAGRSDSNVYSACGHCGDRMTRQQYDAWMRWWAIYEAGQRGGTVREVLENLGV